MSDKDLLSYNERGALAQVLAIEEHLQSMPAGVNNSWCAQKHSLLAVDHHLSEAVNHASRIDPQLANKYRAIKHEAERVLSPSRPGALPDLGAVAELRNRMRKAFNDPTLNSNCPVCKKDDSGLGGLGDLGGVSLRTKETIAAALFGGIGALLLHDLLHKPKRGQPMTGMRLAASLAGAAAGVAMVQTHKSDRYLDGLGERMHVGRSISVLHPKHPYQNGVPAVWGGREIQY